MSVENVMARIAELHQGLVPPSTAAPRRRGGAQFATMLSRLVGRRRRPAGGATPLRLLGDDRPRRGRHAAQTAGQRALAVAQGEVGAGRAAAGLQRLAAHRRVPHRHGGQRHRPVVRLLRLLGGQEAGAPLGEAGQGFGSVAAVASWAQRTGRWNPAASGPPPQAGDLIVWGGKHIGIVESVDADGKIHTIEGNSSNMVTRRTHDASGDGATGYVRLGLAPRSSR